MQELLSSNKNGIVRTGFATAAAFMLVACGSDGYPESHARNCRGGESSGVEATVGSNDENDPLVILSYAEENSEQSYFDEAAKLGLSNFDQDFIDGIGEILCVEGEENDGDTVFSIQGYEIRQDYLRHNPPQTTTSLG